MSNSVSVLEMKNISKLFYNHQVLSNVSICLRPGEVHAILGENGAGKSTLMKILSGVEKPNTGEIFIEGKKVEINNPRQAQEYGISMMFQESMLVPQLTVVENIFLGRWPTYSLKKFPVINRKNAVKYTLDLFHSLGFEINPHAKIKDLGVGQRKMVEIAKALCWKSKIIILDEVTASLNDMETENLFHVLQQSKKISGISIFFISHKIGEVMKIADTITILRDGKVIESSDAKTVDVKSIIYKITGKEFVNRYPKIKSKIGSEILSLSRVGDGHFLNDISFQLHKGEILGLTGLVGSGRTAVANTVFGLKPPVCGDISINGKPVRINSPIDAIQNKIGLISENKQGALVYPMSVAKNITLSHLKGVVTGPVIDLPLENKIAADYIKSLGIKVVDAFKRVDHLSSGNQQKVIISKWMLAQSKILIFDEPTKGLDIPSKVAVYNLINELILKGVGILFISSDLSELVGMCDRILVMHKGGIVKELKGDEISEAAILYHASGGS